MTNLPQEPRIERINLNGHVAWRKRPEVASANRFTALHRLLMPVLPIVLHPTNAAGGIESLHAEAARLQQFSDNGINVPEVLEKTDTYITLADCGMQLDGVLRAQADPDVRVRLLKQAVSIIGSLHSKGLVHGRPKLKDMTLKGAADVSTPTIYLLDLEEDPTAVMSARNAQARDVWLLLASCPEFYEEPEAGLHELVEVYRTTMAADLAPELRALARSLRIVRRLIEILRLTDKSSDIRGSYWATRVLQAV